MNDVTLVALLHVCIMNLIYKEINHNFDHTNTFKLAGQGLLLASMDGMELTKFMHVHVRLLHDSLHFFKHRIHILR